MEDEQTYLARERTKLAWIRTALTSFIAAVTIFKLAPDWYLLGWVLTIMTIVFLIKAVTRK